MAAIPVLLIGCGPMAVEYAKVLKALGIDAIVVGRGAASADKFTQATGLPVQVGGFERWLEREKPPAHAIVATGERWLGAAALALIERGARRLLVEKPGGFDAPDIAAVASKAAGAHAEILVGYNRRFYASVEAARRAIAEDGGVTSFSFEFTEWSHVIGPIEKEPGVKEQWFLANSTHVIDLAFHLGGAPAQLTAFTRGGLAWHPAGSVFAGAGVSEGGALFAYQANWEAPGRWGVEVLTRKRRLILRPLERLQVQKLGSVAIEFVEIDDALDKAYKPGLYRQVQAFLGGDRGPLPTIEEQVAMLPWFLRIRDGKGPA
jgi:predicted dehydrogenase